ncbi:hypothetical protein K461DRAFT_278395 [Myriangium duriaei CBS 260.36]|uniref:Uncharacterized protein n=1 Tax=Myriangium duriaei CBS 260.36 TaxID=1168546 RepID=A0A9P4MKW9_9PEZI|nr:hypothetical protein K461DRAFT_278395 [Myriangium duriaei CBS 260.36]
MLFCNALYSAQAFRASSLAEEAPSSLQAFELQALQRALAVCSWFRDLNPLAKSTIGYSSDMFFAMVAFCCDYIIHVRETLKDVDQGVFDRDHIVLDVAELMVDLGTDDMHCSRILGQRIMNSYNASKSPSPQGFIPNPVKSQQPTPRSSVTYRPTLHQRSCSADVFTFHSSNGTENSFDGHDTSGHSSISHSPQFAVAMPYGSWSTTNLSLQNMELPPCDLNDTHPDAMMPMTLDDNNANKVYGLTADAMWMDDQTLPTPTAFF